MKTENNNGAAITTFEEHLEKRYGAAGSKQRTEFEIKAKAFAIGEIIREERKLANMNDLKTTEESVPFSIAIPNCNL